MRKKKKSKSLKENKKKIKITFDYRKKKKKRKNTIWLRGIKKNQKPNELKDSRWKERHRYGHSHLFNCKSSSNNNSTFNFF